LYNDSFDILTNIDMGQVLTAIIQKSSPQFYVKVHGWQTTS